MVIFARKGWPIYCVNGDHLGYFTCDVRSGDIARAEDVEWVEGQVVLPGVACFCHVCGIGISPAAMRTSNPDGN